MKGILQVTGVLSVSQFWPEGQSDADTAKLQLDVHEDSFTFQASSKEKPSVIKIFEGAIVHGKVTKPAVQKGKLTVRLQGLDAAELHFTPQAILPAHNRTEEQERLF